MRGGAHAPTRMFVPRAKLGEATAVAKATAESVVVADPAGDKRFAIPFKALGYGTKAAGLLAVLREVSDEPTADCTLIERWAELIGLKGSFHFSPLSLI